MHAAPPVRIACNGGASWPRIQIALTAFAGATLGLFVAGWLEWRAVPTAATAAAASLVCGWLASRWAAGPLVSLVWDGQAWTVGEERGRVDVMLDLGGWLLLRHCAGGSARSVRWLAVGAGAAPESFHLWRAALYAPPAPVAAGPRR
jgi:hypothetical protein